MKDIFKIKNEAQEEAYRYFDQHIRPLPKKPDGQFNDHGSGFVDNDVDAFRHAYVSGVFAMEIGLGSAAFWGFLNEITSIGNDALARNMDFWNNKIGRKYGRKAKNKAELLKMIHNALNKGELIMDLKDPRAISANSKDKTYFEKSVIVIEESKTGRNETFLDTKSGNILDREDFVSLIESGNYPGYSVAMIRGVETPVSKGDKVSVNNLG